MMPLLVGAVGSFGLALWAAEKGWVITALLLGTLTGFQAGVAFATWAIAKALRAGR